MRAIRVHEISANIGSVRLEEVSLPAPDPGELRLRVRACALNFPDLLMIQGKYQFKPEVPFSPGMEVSGVVSGIGAGVTGLGPGDEVVAALRCGGFAEEVNVKASSCRPKPPGMSFGKAAAYPVAYLTAYVSLVPRGGLEAGETLLVHGSAGGVGMAAVDLGVLLGAKVIATASTEAKRAVVRGRGALHVIAPSPGFRDEVKRLTDGRGADVIYDPVGGDVFDESVRCIAWKGRLLVVGFASGRIPSLPVNIALIKGFSVVGVRAGETGRRDPEAGARNVTAVDRWAAEGRIDPYLCATFPLEDAVEAMRVIERREVIGKVVLTMD